MEIKSMCATGHRPLNGAWDIAHTDRQTLRENLYPIIKRAHINGGFSTFICGMAQGFDTDFALSVIKLRLEMEGGVFLVAAIPFKNQERAWKKEDQEIYAELINQADSVIEVCDPGFANWKYHARNRFMVDNSEHVLAFWDGSQGGTSATIQYALSAGKPVLNLLSVPIKKVGKSEKSTFLRPIEENLRIFQEHMKVKVG